MKTCVRYCNASSMIREGEREGRVGGGGVESREATLTKSSNMMNQSSQLWRNHQANSNHPLS